MKYDTSPLSIDTTGVDLTPPEQELRFVPEDEHPDSSSISLQTVIAPSLETQVGYSTFIEPPPQTNRLDAIKEKLDSSKYKTWASTALLALFSGFAGGFAVFWIGSEQPPTTQVQPQMIAAQPVTEIQTAEAFVAKPAADFAAEEPLVPHSPEIRAHREVAVNSVTKVQQTVPETAANNTVTSIPAETQVAEADPALARPERESKVGAYIVEKPAKGRRPLARCADGTYSFSASKAAACSGRGGVGEWMSGEKPSTAAAPAKQAAYVLGPRGGCYYLDSSNKKIYVDKKYCQ